MHKCTICTSRQYNFTNIIDNNKRNGIYDVNKEKWYNNNKMITHSRLVKQLGVHDPSNCIQCYNMFVDTLKLIMFMYQLFSGHR